MAANVYRVINGQLMIPALRSSESLEAAMQAAYEFGANFITVAVYVENADGTETLHYATPVPEETA